VEVLVNGACRAQASARPAACTKLRKDQRSATQNGDGLEGTDAPTNATAIAQFAVDVRHEAMDGAAVVSLRLHEEVSVRRLSIGIEERYGFSAASQRQCQCNGYRGFPCPPLA
jgi:hypothetical protein